MKILLSWSSGKDSAWALHMLNLQYPGAVQALLTSTDVTQSAQAELTQCYCDRFYTDPATKAEGFVLPGADTCGSDRPGTMPGVAACEAPIVTCPGVTPESVF